MNEPSPIDPLPLFAHPARLGTAGAAARRRAFGDEVRVRSTRKASIPDAASLTRGEQTTTLPAWPQPEQLEAGDALVVSVPSSTEGRERYVRWLRTLAEATPPELAVAPCSAEAGGMHRLWCIGAARVLLPDNVRIEARHDLIGIRLAQLGVGFGADTLAGPVEPDRRLPVAGVPRPDENTSAGLANLVRQVGLQPQTAPESEAAS